MKALTVLYGGDLSSRALEPLYAGRNSLSLALERSRNFPGTEKLILLLKDGFPLPELSPVPGLELIKTPSWTKKSLLEAVSGRESGYDLVYFAWADCPFLDPALAGAVAGRHVRYAAEYSYADGWPYGFAPEILAPGTAGILCKISGEKEGAEKPGRDTIFSVLQKDINSFDIEAEISPVDLGPLRLSFCADSKRNLMLLSGFAEAVNGVPPARDAASLIAENPSLLRTLPNFYAIQVSGQCPQSCLYCPYPASNLLKEGVMDTVRFAALLDRITDFSDDAVIDLSLWGELALHPQKMELVSMVLARPSLALVIETSGIGWKHGELEACARLSLETEKTPRTSPLPPLSWIVSLDSSDPARYRELRGQGFPEALECAKKLLALFPKDAYVQAVRAAGAEDDIEKFYRSWKEAAPRGASNIIIQKYDDFCGALPKRQASDLSPVERRPCWHIMRDMSILLDGNVLLCREEIAASLQRRLGNVFSESLQTIWSGGAKFYDEQCGRSYSGSCAGCDEYYPYNF
jgi:spiro-SPASM protein